MTENNKTDDLKPKPAGSAESRAAREAAALRRNLLRRKQQKSERGESKPERGKCEFAGAASLG